MLKVHFLWLTKVLWDIKNVLGSSLLLLLSRQLPRRSFPTLCTVAQCLLFGQRRASSRQGGEGRGGTRSFSRVGLDRRAQRPHPGVRVLLSIFPLAWRVVCDVAESAQGVKRRRCRRDAIVKRSNAGFNCVKLFNAADGKAMGARFSGFPADFTGRFVDEE